MHYNNIPIDWNAIHGIIDEADTIMLTTHENPDGDGLGSEGGLYYHLIEKGKDVRIINYSSLPSEYEYLNSDSIFESYDESIHDAWLKNVDLVIIFDVGDYVRIRTLVSAIDKYGLQTMNIDHHPHVKDDIFTHNLVDLSAAATGCMVYDYLKVARNNEPIVKNSLEGIYTAVMTDTGCFKYSNTDNKCHEIAIECLDAGIETHTIYQRIYENSTRSRIKLMGEFLSDLRYELDGSLAWFIISKDMMNKANATRSDVEGFSDMVRTISGVEVALMIFEQGKSNCRINLRSKGKYIVNDIARRLGGGGHAYAAGALIEGNLGDATQQIVNTAKKSIQSQMNGDI